MAKKHPFDFEKPSGTFVDSTVLRRGPPSMIFRPTVPRRLDQDDDERGRASERRSLRVSSSSFVALSFVLSIARALDPLSSSRRPSPSRISSPFECCPFDERAA